MKKIFNQISTAIIIIIFISSIALMIIGTLAMQQNKPIFIFNRAIAVVPTDSMVGDKKDSLDVNDIVVISKIDFKDVKEEDVIVFQGVDQNQNDILVIHRVVRIEDDKIITKGDNNSENDQPTFQDYVTEDNLEGIYRSKITFLKPIGSIMASKRGFIFLGLALVLIVMLVSEVIHLVKMVKEDQEKKYKKTIENELKQLKEETKKELLKEILDENKKT